MKKRQKNNEKARKELAKGPQMKNPHFESTALEALSNLGDVYKAMYQVDENRAAARAAGGYKDDSKKQNDPSKAGFTGISNSIADIMKQNKEIEARKKKSGAKNEEFEQLDELSKGTMGSYVKKASKDVEKRSYTQGSTDAEDAEIGYPGQTPKDKKIDKRQKGIGRAVGKLTR